VSIRFIGGLLVFFGLLFLGIHFLAPKAGSRADAPRQQKPSLELIEEDGRRVIDWRLLGTFDLAARRRSPELVAVDGAPVKIVGFMVPLEDYQSQVSEFLLVPNPMMCIHVPAPPANQMVFVRMKEGAANAVAYTPIWVEGDFSIIDTESPYGETSFIIHADGIRPFSRL
jgi:hypothetical protein